ncbi:MAG: T9SS type A sorting domain-containing protein [Gracilimonas sp.]|uniref:invasin domain 3-containing protein n=1 Tax=Gracilimonas sp. TaxID=1974203 RepID=UPI0019AC9342|nr:invasin domain 3-containing protein [Gracilimonas sp.]MBD3615491.1 T9SS type A sorting domain-containing protein [Gracilimonas sp.]
MAKALKILFAAFVAITALANQAEAQDVIRASGGTNISVDSVVTGGYVSLTGPTIRETATGQLAENGTIILTLPAGYEWNTALTANEITLTITATGAANTQLDASFTGFNNTQEAVFTIDRKSTTSGNGQGPGRIEISGLQLRPANTNIPDINTISNTGTTGPDANYGDLSKEAGSIAEVSVETQADGNGVIVPAQDILAGNSLTVYAIARDIGGNFIENIALASETDWKLIDVTGTITQGAVIPADDLKSAVFSSQQTGTAKIEAFYADVTVTPSQDITVLPRSPAEMVFSTQPPSTATAGEPFSNSTIVHLLDQFGNLVTTDDTTKATISISSGNGTLSGTLSKQAVNGVITFDDLSTDIANSINLSVASLGFSAITTNTITVDHNTATDLTYLVQPTNTAQNSTIDPPVEIQLLDNYGNYVDSVVTVTISNESYFKNTSTLTSDTDANGVAVFGNLIIDGPGQAPVGVVNFTAGFTGINSPVVSDDFEIISGDDLAKFVIETTGETNIGEQVAGQAFDIRIRALDGNNNVFTNFDGGVDTVMVTSDSDILLNGSIVTKFTTDAFVQGVLDTAITLTTAGLTRIYAENDSLNRSGQSNEFNVTPTVYDLTTSEITADPTSIVADGNSTSAITVQLKDEFGNNLTSGSETIELTTDAGTFPGEVTTVSSTDQPDGTFTTSLTSSENASEVATIRGTINSGAITDSATVEFLPGDVDRFIISLPETSAVPDTQTAGVPFNIDIEAVDISGNRVEGFNGNVTISTNSVIASGAAATLSGGILNSHSITLTKSNNLATVTVTADDLFDVDGTSKTFVIVANTPSAVKSQVVASPRVLQNDPAFQSVITVILRDEYSNRVLTQETVGLALEQLEENSAPSSGAPDASLSGISWNSTQFNYTDTLTASTTIELIEITGSFGNSPATIIFQRDTVDILVPNTWTAGAGGPTNNKTDWTNPDNWTSGVPTSDDYVIIPDVGEVPVLDLNITIGSFEIQENVSLTLFGGNAISVSGDTQIDGSLDIEDNTDIAIGGSFSGIGSFTAGANTTIEVGGNISIGSFLARTEGTFVTMNGVSPQTISTQNFLAQNLNIENDVTATTATDLIDVSTVNIAADQTFELANGAGITIDVETEITGDGNFILNDNTFVLRGNSGLGNVDASEGTVIFGIRLDEDFVDYPDLQQQQIAGLSEMKNAIINNTAGVRTFEDVIVSGALTLENGPLIISSGKSLIAPNITYNNGTIRMRRNISATQGWRMISPPLDTTYADFLDKTVTQGYPNSSLGDAASDSLQPNVLYYLESYGTNENNLPATDNDRWRAPADANNMMTPGQGLFVYFFGDISTDNRYNTPLPLTLDIEGREHNGNGTTFTFPVTYTADADTGWNLVGNPFAASIDWDAPGWTKTNIDNVIYVWDPSSNDYLYWNGIGGGDLEGIKLSNGIIRPFQAFWVKANAANPELSIGVENKTTGGTFAGKERRNPAAIGMKLSADGQEKAMHITLSPDGSNGKDIRDAYRLLPFDTNTYLEFYSTRNDGTELAINNLARSFGTEISIPIHVGGFTDGIPLNGSYTISWPEFGDVPAAWTLILEDTKTSKKTNLRKENSYTFSLEQNSQKVAVNNTIENFTLRNSDTDLKSKTSGQQEKARFFLRIQPGEDAEGLPGRFELYNNYPNPFNPTTTIRFAVPLEGRVQLSIYDILGRKVADLIDENYRAGFHEVQWNANSLASGMYIYRLTTQDGVFTKKMSLIK